jgi:hypothetical protein
VPHEFTAAAGGQRAVQWATDALKLFDAIAADGNRRNSIAAVIKAVLP